MSIIPKGSHNLGLTRLPWYDVVEENIHDVLEKAVGPELPLMQRLEALRALRLVRHYVLADTDGAEVVRALRRHDGVRERLVTHPAPAKCARTS